MKKKLKSNEKWLIIKIITCLKSRECLGRLVKWLELKPGGQEAELVEPLLIYECGEKRKQGETRKGNLGTHWDWTEASEFPWAVIWGFKPSLTRYSKSVQGGMLDIWNTLRLPGFVCLLQPKVNYEYQSKVQFVFHIINSPKLRIWAHVWDVAEPLEWGWQITGHFFQKKNGGRAWNWKRWCCGCIEFQGKWHYLMCI